EARFGDQHADFSFSHQSLPELRKAKFILRPWSVATRPKDLSVRKAMIVWVRATAATCLFAKRAEDPSPSLRSDSGWSTELPELRKDHDVVIRAFAVELARQLPLLDESVAEEDVLGALVVVEDVDAQL